MPIEAVTMIKFYGLLSATFCFLALPVGAQEGSRKNTIFVGGGAAVPGRQLDAYMSTSASFQLGYGYRLRRNFQLDIAATGVVGAAGIRRSELTSSGEVHISDSETLVTFGGRAIVPLAHGRVEVFGGGGGSFLYYEESAGTKLLNESCLYPSSIGPCVVEQVCPTCTSRSGWGFYGLGGASVALDHRRRWWLDIESRAVKGTTSGKLLGSGAPFGTRDGWIGAAMNIGYRF